MSDSLSPKTSTYLKVLISAGLLAVLIYYNGIFFPFILALSLVYWIGPSLRKWQKWFKKWELSVLAFLSAIILGVILFFSIGANFIIRDLERFNDGFTYLWTENQAELDKGAQQVKDWLNGIYDTSQLEADLKSELNSLQANTDSTAVTDKLDWDAISESLDKVKGFFSQTEDKANPTWQWPEFGFWYKLGSFLLYFVLGLFYYPYFEGLKSRFQNTAIKGSAKMFWQDFEQSFIKYFRLRTRIILWQMPLFLLTFILFDLPGTFLYLALIFILLYIPYLHYILLIPIALSALVLSTELSMAYWLIMLLILLSFVLNSILEEALLIPRIMEANIGINPVIMILGLSFWTYVIGTWGLLIGIPLTSLGIIYLKRYLLPYWFEPTK